METFVDLLKEGKVSVDDIDDFVDQWHESDSNLSLVDFLGLTQSQYSEWVKTGMLVVN